MTIFAHSDLGPAKSRTHLDMKIIFTLSYQRHPIFLHTFPLLHKSEISLGPHASQIRRGQTGVAWLVSSLWELTHEHQFLLASSLQNLATHAGKSLLL